VLTSSEQAAINPAEAYAQMLTRRYVAYLAY